MQNKGIIKLFAIIFGLICLYYLSFTWTAKKLDDKVAAIEDVKAKKQYLDTLNANYLITKYSYNDVKARAINLGLDLKGGINATLEVSVKDILKGLSTNSKNKVFNQALDKASEMQKDANTAYFDLFIKAFTDLSKGTVKLNDPTIFGNLSLKEKIKPAMNDVEVAAVLKDQVDASIGTAFRVLRNRIDQFGVTQPNIQRVGNTGRILIELPGAKDIERVRKLLTGTAKLQFWEVFNNQELFGFLGQANQKLATIITPQETPKKETDANSEENKDAEIDDLMEGKQDDEALKAENPLFSLLAPNYQGTGPVLGRAAIVDTTTVMDYLHKKEVRALLPSELRYAKFVWDMPEKDSNVVSLYALKSNRNGVAPIEGDVISSASQEFSQFGTQPEISMTMKTAATKKWAKMTEKNTGKWVAVVLDNKVYTAPQVNGKIPNGRTSITGAFSIEEAQDIANALQSGKLPAKAHIIQSEIVGPSLGQEAIDSGIMSFLLALALILLWMIFYYGKAGIATDIALAANMLFIFGILTAFGAVLTLPGIAGIVLTIGMAVDANVLIYERIKEELSHGKALKEAVADGYKASLPSILDANITTFLTGLILFSFGSGPIKGFAYTLMVGIITSLFSAIFVSRLIVDWYINRGNKLTFNTSITKNWFKNINIDFLKKSKMALVISGVLLLAGLGSLMTQGLNYGVDFKGGRTYTVRFDQKVSAAEVATSLKEAFGNSLPNVKTYGGNNQLKITTNYKIDETAEGIDKEIQTILFDKLKPLLPDGTTFDKFKVGSDINQTVGVMESVQVGPTIADDIKKDALWAVLGSLL
ncbi:MAG: protein translocase subunit SecDF, partial [Flavobacteriaceae bacterium]